MNCETVKEIIPAYVAHTAGEEDITRVEEHLCTCNECRQFLSQLLDKPHKHNPAQESQTPIQAKITPKTIGLWDYVILGTGLLVLIFFIILIIKG